MSSTNTARHLVQVGDVIIGGGGPPVIQAMIKANPHDVHACVREISRLQQAGARIVRLAVPDRQAVECLRAIVPATSVPLIADIHFDHRLGIAAIDAGVHKVRVNPGNLSPQQLSAVAARARQAGIPLRLGVNSGSLPATVLNKVEEPGMGAGTKDTAPSAVSLVEATAGYVGLLEQQGFFDIVVSIKCSDVPATIAVNRLLAERVPYPIHLGVTATGPAPGGIVKSAIGIGTLLQQGIGATFRVSLTGDSVEEVRVAREILISLDLVRAPRVVACPTCGRAQGDVRSLAAAVQEYLSRRQSSLVIAVMGCEVNGPGEAREADVGIACTRGGGILFRKGRRVRHVRKGKLLPELLSEIHALELQTGTATEE